MGILVTLLSPRRRGPVTPVFAHHNDPGLWVPARARSARLAGTTATSNRVPGEHVAGALERRQRRTEGALELLGELLRRPAVGAVDDADRARLIEQEDLVVAHGQHLAGNAARRLRAEIDRERRDL